MSQPKEIPKNYDPIEVEERWMNTWKKEDYYFDRHSKKPQFVIDTPPPYPTGNFHIGNALPAEVVEVSECRSGIAPVVC